MSFNAIIVWTFFCVLQSCFGQSRFDKKSNAYNYKETSFDKDIPPNKWDTSYFKIKKGIESNLGIGSIENGSKDLQIRIWRGFPHTDFMQLSIFSKRDNNWSAYLYNLVLHYNRDFDSIIAITKDLVEKPPCSGWDSFADSLFKLDVLYLPDDSKIENYHDNLSMDSETITIEIATENNYRIYSYADVKNSSHKTKNAKKVLQILELIQKEF